MCGIQFLKEGKLFDGFIVREKNGFVFHLPELCNMEMDELHKKLLAAEKYASGIHERKFFPPLKIRKMDKHFIRKMVLTLNRAHGLPGVNGNAPSAYALAA